MELLIKAINFAAIAHKNQVRKDVDSTPYINHPIEVMTILNECGINDVDVLCAAVLHDTVEDTPVTNQMLIENFGIRIASIVAECSDDKNLDQVERKRLQITHATSASDEAKLVKGADKLSNLSSLLTNPPKYWSKEQIDGYFIWSFCVCSKTSGVNENLDERLNSIFSKKEITNFSEKDVEDGLNSYYSLLDNLSLIIFETLPYPEEDIDGIGYGDLGEFLYGKYGN